MSRFCLSIGRHSSDSGSTSTMLHLRSLSASDTLSPLMMALMMPRFDASRGDGSDVSPVTPST